MKNVEDSNNEVLFVSKLVRKICIAKKQQLKKVNTDI